MNRTRIITGVSAVVAAAALIGTGAALSGAATGPAASTPSATSSPSGDKPAGHAHTPVTGAELAEVTAAVKAKDSAVTVTTVQKDPDGSYDVDGTKAGAAVRLEVSADLKTITTSTGRGQRGPGAPTSPDTANTTTTSASV
ncbi:hypothetical protein [Oryzobacter telluris]|uniref:hypothetical protein n=1 Tax=Oryzobacter telluris TaxID=3149179 RepID=UPI00370D5314